MCLNYSIFAIPLPFFNYYFRQNKLSNMFHVLKWADISINNPLKTKKINNFFQVRPAWLKSAEADLAGILTSLKIRLVSKILEKSHGLI
jgi:hypothetical protein